MNYHKKYNIEEVGSGSKTMILSHGFGCNREMWRHLIPIFENEYRIVMFDHIGTGHSDMSAYTADKYAKLEGYASDIVEFCQALDYKDAIFVGHSVSATMGILAHNESPDLFSAIVLICPSPCYINSENYVGGFEKEDIEELMGALESNYLGWSSATAPAIIGNPDRPELGTELTNSFCRMDPKIAENFAKATFYSDNRKDLEKVNIPTLILQTKEDIIAPIEVGQFVHEKIKNSELAILNATGHLPHVSKPQECIPVIKKFLTNLS